MHPFAQVLLDGIFTGSTYALMAAGLALILGVVKVVNLAHGAFFSLGAYIAYVLSAKGVSHPAAAVKATFRNAGFTVAEIEDFLD